MFIDLESRSKLSLRQRASSGSVISQFAERKLCAQVLADVERLPIFRSTRL